MTDRDPATVLASEEVAEIEDLLDTVAGPATDLEISHTNERPRRARYQVLEADEDQQDFTTALALFTPVYGVRLDADLDPVSNYLP